MRRLCACRRMRRGLSPAVCRGNRALIFSLKKNHQFQIGASMSNLDWIKEFPAAVTICDKTGIILDMNDKASKMYEKDGGRQVIGRNILDCHLEQARRKTQALLSTGEKNIYTIEKNGIKKLIYQSPWFINGQYAGLVELALEIPFEMP